MALDIIIDSSNDDKFFDSIRRLLGGVDEEVLSNEDILDPAFFDMAEIEIMGLVPCVTDGDLSDSDKAKAKMAMTYLIASMFCPTVKGRVEYEVKTIDVTWRKSPVKFEELQEYLLNKVDELLNGLDCYEGGADFNIFAVAPSKRAVKERYEL